jgi:hypothetical protein
MKTESLERSFDQFFLEELAKQYPPEVSSPALRVRDGRIIELEKRLHHGPRGRKGKGAYRLGLDKWSKDHSHGVQHIGTLPYMPDLIRPQRFERASTPINKFALRLPESAYLKTYRFFYNHAVGSEEVAKNIIESFNTTPAFPESRESLVDYAIDCLDNGVSFGISSAHFDRLSDVADFGAGLSLAVAARKGRKYISNFKLLVNKNMTRETYKNIPIPLLISLGMVAYWGLPQVLVLKKPRYQMT